MVVNLLLVRVLLVHVVLRLWQCGIGPRPTTETSLRTVAHNLQCIASTLFMVFERLVPSLQTIKKMEKAEQAAPAVSAAAVPNATSTSAGAVAGTDLRRLDELERV